MKKQLFISYTGIENGVRRFGRIVADFEQPMNLDKIESFLEGQHKMSNCIILNYKEL